MRYQILGLSFLIAVSGLAGCGDSASDDSGREFGKAIDLVNYSLKNTNINIQLGAGSGTIQELKSNINYIPKKSKDKIIRRIDGANFKLQVNGVDALIPVSSQENINHEQKISENFQSCKIIGISKVDGKASSLKIDLRWKLNLRLEGDSCEAFIPKYQSFLKSELDRFNLTVVKDLINSTDLTEDDQREITINLNLTGESD